MTPATQLISGSMRRGQKLNLASRQTPQSPQLGLRKIQQRRPIATCQTTLPAASTTLIQPTVMLDIVRVPSPSFCRIVVTFESLDLFRESVACFASFKTPALSMVPPDRAPIPNRRMAPMMREYIKFKARETPLPQLERCDHAAH